MPDTQLQVQSVVVDAHLSDGRNIGLLVAVEPGWSVADAAAIGVTAINDRLMHEAMRCPIEDEHPGVSCHLP